VTGREERQPYLRLPQRLPQHVRRDEVGCPVLVLHEQRAVLRPVADEVEHVVPLRERALEVSQRGVGEKPNGDRDGLVAEDLS